MTHQELEAGIIPINNNGISSIYPEDQILDGVIDSGEFDIPADGGFIKIGKLSGNIDSNQKDKQGIFVKPGHVSKYYGIPRSDGAFLKRNLFSELASEYERETARKNLGIASKYAMLWGNMSGNLLNQQDLVKFVSETSAKDINKIIDELNLKLSQWAYDINEVLKIKADINSPNFTGIPTAPHPSIHDDSNRIPTTAFVNAAIDNALEGPNLKSLTVSPDFIYLGEEAEEIVVTWRYEEDVEQQWLNGIELDPSIRTYKFHNISDTKYIRLKYIHGGVTYAKAISFDVVCPLYIGVSPSYEECERSRSYKLQVNANVDEYIYIFVPDGKNARLYVNGICGGFKQLGTIKINNTTYFVYKSDNADLGKTTIDVINQDFTIGQVKYLSSI